MKKIIILSITIACTLNSCGKNSEKKSVLNIEKHQVKKKDWLKDVVLEKELLYDQHTLTDTYPYKDTVRMFQWDKIRHYLAIVDSIQEHPSDWGILQNKSNIHGYPPKAKNSKKNEYHRVVDMYGIEETQAIPLYLSSDSIVPERYGLDGSLVKIENENPDFVNISTIYFPGNWIVPKKYVDNIQDTVSFKKVIMVDRNNQNIATIEKVDNKWLVRSMNPATTGAHHPPYQKPTPLGIFVLQEKKEKMLFTADGSKAIAGFAPYANRFCDGGYIHGVPVNYPHRKIIEFSSTLGTIPHSHMCVRTASSHSKYIYDWAPVNNSLVIVIE
jgi:hypothetical protein